VKALTLTQPWASLVALGAKLIETRSWQTSHRGRIAIHAGQGLGPVGGVVGLWDLCGDPAFFRALSPHVRTTRLVLPSHGETDCIEVSDLPRGAIIAVADLVDVRPICDGVREYGMHLPDGERIWPLTDQERAFGDYSPGRFAWLLANIRPLAVPVPAKGALGLWTVPGTLAAQIAQTCAEVPTP